MSRQSVMTTLPWACAANAGDLSAESLGDLDGEAAHSSGRTDDQYVFAQA